MKRFVYFQLVDEDNFCNYQKEQALIAKAIENNQRLVIYGPRNYGKTSLMKNIIAKKFGLHHKKSFIFFVDLLEVRNLEDISSRINNTFSQAFSKTFPVNTGEPSLGFLVNQSPPEKTTEHLFSSIQLISKKIPTLIIMDEFQDIARVAGAQALLRNVLESLDRIPIVLMGSQQHLLANILASPQAPLAFWGKDIHFKEIPYPEYTAYINERFHSRNMHISDQDSKYLQDLLNRIPESINIVCDHVFNNFEEKEIFKNHITSAIQDVVENIAPRYERFLSHFTQNEERFFSVIAKQHYLSEPMGNKVVSAVGITPRAISKIIDKSLHAGIINREDGKYYLTDPLFREYIKKYKGARP